MTRSTDVSIHEPTGEPRIRPLRNGRDEVLSVTIENAQMNLTSYERGNIVLQAAATENARGHLYLSRDYARNLAMSILAALAASEQVQEALREAA